MAALKEAGLTSGGTRVGPAFLLSKIYQLGMTHDEHK
jgi:hypothetical protein